MQFKFNIPVLFERAFGVTPNRGVQQMIDKVQNYDDIETLAQEQEYSSVSKLGVQVWDVINLDEKIIEGTDESFEGYSFPAELTLQVSRAKKIIETDIIGKKGTVEELVAVDDWEINIKGFIINYESDAYPENEVQELNTVCELQDSLLPVTSKFLNNLGIDYLSIHQLRLPQMAGYSNVQPFEVVAKSKEPFILSVINGIEL